MKSIKDFDADEFKIDKCYHLDGAYKEGQNRRILCTFNWHYEAQCVLRNRSSLPKGVYISEDLPEEWVNRCKVLKPIFNAAKCMDTLKKSTKLSKDKLIIAGRTYSVAPTNNLDELGGVLNVANICQHSNDETIIFLGSHSPFSNLYHSSLVIDNETYNSVEQHVQSAKAGLFNDDITQAKIKKEKNTYKIKKLGSHVKNFSIEKWRSVNKEIVQKTVRAKFMQNATLNAILKSNGEQNYCRELP